METVLVTAGIDAAAGHNHECKCTVDLVQGILYGIYTRQILVYTLLLDQMGKHFSIR